MAIISYSHPKKGSRLAGLDTRHFYPRLATLFCGEVSEKLIQRRTGHKSLIALRQHEIITETQFPDVFNVLCS